MAVTSDLMGIGMPAEIARRVGFQDNGSRGQSTLSGVGTAQVGAAQIKKNATFLRLTTASGQTAAILPSDAEIMVPYFIDNITSDAGLIFPPTGGSINAVAANSSVSIAQNVARIFFRVNATRWISFLAA